ncbi:MAG: HYR domain-containing protein, partial [Bacteroidota bacterium]
AKIAGFTTNCEFSVTVKDAEAPKINCPSNIQQATQPGATTAKINFDIPTATDNCGTPTISQKSGQAPNADFPIGATKVVYTAKDEAGNTTDCDFTVTITETPALALNCPKNMEVEADAGKCTAQITYADATANLPDATVNQAEGPKSGANFPSGKTTVRYEAKIAGFTTNCEFSVTVKDAEAPKINCPSNIQQATQPGATTSKINFDIPTASDNCGTPTVSKKSGQAPNTDFPIGMTKVAYAAKDEAGNTSDCEFTVTVSEVQKLSLQCPENIRVEAKGADCAAKVEFAGARRSLADATVQRAEGLASGAAFPVGVTGVRFAATHASGQETDCSFIVEVRDAAKPSISCPDRKVVATQPGSESAIVNYGAATASDNCGKANVTLKSGLESGKSFPVGKTKVTYTAKDEAGNTTECSFEVEVTATARLALNCPEKVRVNADPGTCGAKVNYAAATANIADATVKLAEGKASGAQFAIGVSGVRFSATDANGQKGDCAFLVEVVDAEKPTVSCPGNMKYSTKPGETTTKINYPEVTATDNCGKVDLVGSKGKESGAEFAVGKHKLTYRATDEAGNTAECSFEIEVEGVNRLALNCPDNMRKTLPAGKCALGVSYTTPSTNFSGVAPQLSEGLKSGASFPFGVTIVRYSAKGKDGQEAECSFVVEVADEISPQIKCPENIVANAEPETNKHKVSYPKPTASDNCGTPDIKKTKGLLSGADFPIGTTEITYEARDKADNKAECSFSVEVKPTYILKLACPNDLRVETDPGECHATVIYTDPRISKGFPGAQVKRMQGLASGAEFPIGTTVMAYQASSSGQEASCIFKVLVADREKPEMTCPEDIEVRAGKGKSEARVPYTKPKATDNCGPAALKMTAGLEGGSLFPLGTTSITYKAKDKAGNIGECNFDVTVLESLEDLAEKALPKTLDGDTINYQDAIVVRNQDIVIYYYDHQNEDGDIVSINYDGDWVVNKFKIRLKTKNITNNPKMELHLEPAKVHYLISKAWNLGKEGINTLTLAIYDGKTAPRILRMNSKIGTSAANKLMYKP